MDAHALLHDPAAFPTLDTVREAASSTLPGYALPREIAWRKGNRDKSFTWDEIYILPENLFLVSAMGAGPAFRPMAEDYLLDAYFHPLARNENVLGGLHAYSHVNALCSAMQAWFSPAAHSTSAPPSTPSACSKPQSFSTGGWAPGEPFESPAPTNPLRSPHQNPQLLRDPLRQPTPT